MALNTGISWAHHTVNLWWGCVEVSPGCDHCYAKTLATRYGRDVWGTDKPRWFTKNWRGILRTAQRIGEKTGERQRVFIQSMSDICELLHVSHPSARQINEVRAELFDMWPSLTMVDGLFLTKRIGNAAKVFPASWFEHWPANAWMGISVVNQAEADRDIPKLLAIPSGVRFLSCEPLIAPISFQPGHLSPFDVNWVIVGGESGGNARSMELTWAHAIRRQCKAAEVAFFMKQLGRSPLGCSPDGLDPWPVSDSHGANMNEWPEVLRVQELPR